ncbi:MAG: nucleotidyl transferase AbiEii/AbiGii toxin family protein [Candidatus Aminicenantales bacterium]
MSEQILSTLKRKLEDLSAYSAIDAETKRNTLKEELQFYVLNFIYHHPEYSRWIMYGGSALRVIHDLDRMSVDLDFEISHTITEMFLEKLKKDIEKHFASTYATEPDFLTIKTTTGRGLLLKFNVGKELSIGHPSKQVHIKIDLNHFNAPKTVTERRPINRNQLSFVVTTYNMSALMASKIAAIFLRGTRGVGEAMYEEKGRDIYDLLWYMNKKVVPDLDYLMAKGIDVKDPQALFDKLTIQMNRVSNNNLKHDLTPLFVNQIYIEHWLMNWRESYLRLLNEYEINAVTTLESIRVHQDFNTDNYSFVYRYRTEEGGSVRIVYTISDYWMDFREGDLPIKIDDKIIQLVEGDMKDRLSDKLKQYVTLFYEKTEAYFRKTGRIILRDKIITKVIRMTADNLNQREQIVLNKSALLSCELDDLFR